jgi:putative flippase GtrA
MSAALKMRLKLGSLSRLDRESILPLTTQFFRYAATGATSNIVLYGLYLVATGMGALPKTAMSLLYLLGVLQTFVVNRAWSFRHRGSAPAALLRYFAAYAIGYAINLTILVLFSDFLGFDHRYVQASAIIIITALLFFMQRHWVFRPRGAVGGRAI